MSTLIIFFISALFFISICEFVTYIVYGGFVSKSVSEEYMNLDISKLRFNSFDSSIIMIVDQSLSDPFYIDKVPVSVFSKYHINELGTVPRWSKLSKRIDEFYKNIR